MSLPPDRALAEIDELLRTLPKWEEFQERTPEALSWRGRFTAVLHAIQGTRTQVAFVTAGLDTSYGVYLAHGQMVALLHEVRYTAVLASPVPTSMQFASEAPFDYFDEVRKLASTAVRDVLFVDPYLDASFISRYMPHIAAGACVRLLGSKGIAALASAASMFTAQYALPIEVRQASSALHDRFVFIDGGSCYQSGASFKDGGVKAPATIAQIVDAFPAVKSTYEALWAAGSTVA